jgi:hypothetical protein
MTRTQVVHFDELDWTREEQKSLIGHQQRKSRQVRRRAEKCIQQKHATPFSAGPSPSLCRSLTLLDPLALAQLCNLIQVATKAYRAGRKLLHDELKYFRSFLDRMGPDARRQWLNNDLMVRIRFTIVLGHQGECLFSPCTNIHCALDNFVSSRGQIVFPYDPAFRSLQEKETSLWLLKSTLERSDNREFQYTPMDRFLQFLLSNEETVTKCILNPASFDGTDPEFLRDLFPRRDLSHMGQFLKRCRSMRAASMPPNSLSELNRVLDALKGIGVYNEKPLV